MKTTRLTIAVLLWLGMSGEDAFAAACASVATGNWNARATWGTAAVGCVGDADGIPDADDDVTISAGHTVSLNGNRDSRSFTIAATGQLNDTGDRLTINNNGNVVINGTWNGSGRLRKNGTGTLSGGGSVVGAVRFDIRGNTTVLVGTNLTFTDATNSRIDIDNNIVVTNRGTVTVARITGGNAASTWTNAANSTLNASADLLTLTTGTLTASANGNTVNYTGAAQTIKLPSAGTYWHLGLSGSNTKTPVAGTYTISGNFTLGAGVTYAGNTNNPVVNLAGNFTNNGTFNSGTGLFTFNGTTGAQALTGATTFTNMRMNNGNGLTINNDVTVGTLLTLTSGVITTGSNTLITSANCNAPAVSRPVGGGHIAGNLQKRIPTGGPITCTFEIGDATTYRPVALTFASVTTAGNVTGSVTQAAGDHPDTTNNASGINDTLSINRYWTFTNSGTVFTTFDAQFNYVAGDLDGAATAANFVVARGDTCVGSGAGRTCATWATTTPSAPPTNTQASASGFAGFGDFAIGEWETPNFSREPQFIYTRELY